MNAVISGQAGVALLVDGERMSSLRASRPGEVIRRSPGEVPLLFGDAKDLQFLEETDIEEVSRRLEEARYEVDALHLALILLDESLSPEARTSAAEELEEMLEKETTHRFVEKILHAQPLPRGVDLGGVLAVCPGSANLTRNLLEKLRSLQGVIAEVDFAWKQISEGLFANKGDKAYAQSIAVREGFFRDLVGLHARAGSFKGFEQRALHNSSFRALPNYDYILREWLTPLRANSAPDDLEKSSELAPRKAALSGPFASIRWIWKNGQLIDFEKATVHVLSHALHYGSGVFEGIRCYNTRQGPAVFRLVEHIRRLENSAKVYRMPIAFTTVELAEACCETIRANELQACYIRPIIFRGFGTLGVDPLRSPIEVFIAAWHWGKYLGEEAEQGVDACVSSWRRVSSDAMPAVSKATGNYLNAQLIKMDAICNGYVEGISLDSRGFVSEGSGENVFVVQDGTLITPPIASSILSGITRDTVLRIARDLGIPVREEVVPRGQLYFADEAFFTGTAAEITPIRSIDRIPVGRGWPGEVTKRIFDEFKGITSGAIKDRHGWLYPVYSAVQAEVPEAKAL